MNTAAKRRRRAGKRPRRDNPGKIESVMTTAEATLRKALYLNGHIKNVNDDSGVLRWLGGLHSAYSDCRSEWERKLEDKLNRRLHGTMDGNET